MLGLTANGAIDTTCGNAGFAGVEQGSQASVACSSLAAQSDDWLLVAGSNSSHGMLVRLLVNGARDAGFSAPAVAAGMVHATALGTGDDGPVLVAGRGDASDKQITVPIASGDSFEGPEFFSVVLDDLQGGAGLGTDISNVQIAAGEGLLGFLTIDGRASIVADEGNAYAELSVIYESRQPGAGALHRYLRRRRRRPAICDSRTLSDFQNCSPCKTGVHFAPRPGAVGCPAWRRSQAADMPNWRSR